jgi:hypothetical protein
MSIRSLFGGIVADSPVPLAPRWASGNRLAAGMGSGEWFRRDRRSDLAALNDTSATLYGVVTKLARMTSLVEWDLCRKTDDPDQDPEPLTGQQAANAAPLKVWNNPTGGAVPYMTRPFVVAGTQQHKDLCGELWFVVTKFAGIPVQLWPVRPDRMFPIPSATKMIAGYVYRGPDGEEVPLDTSDVITSFSPDSMDWTRGMGPLGALSRDLAQNDAQSAWQAAHFRNSAQPGGIITIGRRLQDIEWDSLMERWRANHQGVTNAGRIAVLEEGEFTPLSHTQRDMQFVESKQLTRDAIFDAYGFPKFGLGDVDDVNRASATALKAFMAETLTIPRLEDWKALLNGQYLPMFGRAWQGYEFHYRNPVPADAESDRTDLKFRAEAFAILVREGVDPAQASEVCSLPPLTVTKPEPIAAPPMPGQQDTQEVPPDGE